jgi:hypothetical protein
MYQTLGVSCGGGLGEVPGVYLELLSILCCSGQPVRPPKS